MDKWYRIFGHNTEIGITKDGGGLEWSRGCNGERHVDQLMEIFYDEDRQEVVYAEHLIDIDRGACDKTCGHEDRGFFSFEKSHDIAQTIASTTSPS